MKEAKFYPFDKIPIADTNWSLSTGPDRRIYTVACMELRGGGTATVVRYNSQEDQLEYLFDMGDVLNDRFDSGRATQCKIHYSFAPSEKEHIMYMATHLSAPAFGDILYSPWADWKDERKAFKGAGLVAFDTKHDEIRWSRIILPWEGCRCLALNDERDLIYLIGYPRNHFYVYDLKKDTLTDYGLLGAINPQAIWLDQKRRAYTTDDYGRILRFDPDKKRLEELDLYIPRSPYQNGWHSVVYDVVSAPDGEAIYGVPWRGQPHLFRHIPEDGPQGSLEDLGPATQMERDRQHAIGFFIDHVGGMVFGPDGMLYYVKSVWPGGEEMKWSQKPGWYLPLQIPLKGIVVRFNPKTNEKEDFAELSVPNRIANYVSRAGMDQNGDLFFGHVGGRPPGIFKISMGYEKKIESKNFPLRFWG